jgi:hypothetical protein
MTDSTDFHIDPELVEQLSNSIKQIIDQRIIRDKEFEREREVPNTVKRLLSDF